MTTDAGEDHTGVVDPDGTAPPTDASPRLLPHDGVKVTNVALGVVYVGDLDAGGPPVETPTLSWLLASAYWGLLAEYGIGPGTLAGSTRVSAAAFLQPGDVGDGGLVDLMVLQTRILQAVHPEAGAPLVSIPGAREYAVYLPQGVNVALGVRGTYVYQTCIDTNGYHGFDGQEAYTVFPPCDQGQSAYAASHEIAELATDPQPYHGWVSDVDIPVNGGEVADLCAQQVEVEGMTVTELWSNAAGGCVP